jgi:membrane protease YdiL (CAAX protease family)
MDNIILLAIYTIGCIFSWYFLYKLSVKYGAKLDYNNPKTYCILLSSWLGVLALVLVKIEIKNDQYFQKIKKI